MCGGHARAGRQAGPPILSTYVGRSQTYENTFIKVNSPPDYSYSALVLEEGARGAAAAAARSRDRRAQASHEKAQSRKVGDHEEARRNTQTVAESA